MIKQKKFILTAYRRKQKRKKFIVTADAMSETLLSTPNWKVDDVRTNCLQ